MKGTVTNTVPMNTSTGHTNTVQLRASTRSQLYRKFGEALYQSSRRANSIHQVRQRQPVSSQFLNELIGLLPEDK